MEQFEFCRGEVDAVAVDGCRLFVEVKLEAVVGEQMFAEAGFDDVHNVVADFLAIRDNVGVDCAERIGKLMGVDAHDGLHLELVAEFVDVCFDGDGIGEREVFAASADDYNHLDDGFVDEAEHVVESGVLVCIEIFFIFAKMDEGPRHFVAGIADGFQFANLTENHARLLFCLVREMLVADLFQVVGYFYLHVVGDGFVTFDACELAFKLFLVFLVDEYACYTEHAMDAFGVMDDFLLSLEDGYFRRLHDAGTDVVQCSGLLGFVVLLCQQSADNFFHLWDETDEQCRVEDVETGVEHGQHDWNEGSLTCDGGIVTDKKADHIDEGIEDDENPDDAEDVEEQMSQRGSSGLRVCAERGQVGCGGGADVLSHDEGDAHVDGQHACGAEQDGDGHDCCRRLHDAGDDRASEEECEDGEIAAGVEGGEELDDVGIVSKVHVAPHTAEHDERPEEEGQAEEKFSCHAMALLVDEQHANEEGGKHDDGEVEVVAERHNPGRERRADVGAHDDGDGLSQSEQAGGDERDRHDRGGRG